MEVFLDVRSEGQEGVEDLDLRIRALVVEVAVEDFEDEGKDHREEWLELRIKRFSESLDERD